MCEDISPISSTQIVEGAKNRDTLLTKLSKEDKKDFLDRAYSIIQLSLANKVLKEVVDEPSTAVIHQGLAGPAWCPKTQPMLDMLQPTQTSRLSLHALSNRMLTYPLWNVTIARSILACSSCLCSKSSYHKCSSLEKCLVTGTYRAGHHSLLHQLQHGPYHGHVWSNRDMLDVTLLQLISYLFLIFKHQVHIYKFIPRDPLGKRKRPS